MPAPSIENLKTVDRVELAVWSDAANGNIGFAFADVLPGNRVGSATLFSVVQSGAGVAFTSNGGGAVLGSWYGSCGPAFAPIALDPTNPQQSLLFQMTGGFSFDLGLQTNGIRLYVASSADWSEYAWWYLGGTSAAWYSAGNSTLSTHQVRGTPDYATAGFDPLNIVRIGWAHTPRQTFAASFNFRGALGPICYLNGPIRLTGGEVGDPHSFAVAHALLRDPSQPFAAWISEAAGIGYEFKAPISVEADYFDAAVAAYSFAAPFGGTRYDDARGYFQTPAGAYSYAHDLPAGGFARYRSGLWSAPIAADVTLAGAGNTFESVVIQGAGAVVLDGTVDAVTFASAQSVAIGGAQTSGCVFPCPVTITAASGLNGGAIRATSGAALTVAGGPGDYSAVTPQIASPSATYDLEAGAGGAGAYDLSGVTVPAGYTLRLHNPTADAITVALAAGITAATSGGSITITQPQPTQSVTVSNGVPGTLLLIQDVTDPEAPETLFLGAPASWPYTWTDPSPYAADRDIRVRAMYQSGTSATTFVDELIGAATLATPALAYRLNQRTDEVHTINGIDGSTVSGITIDDANLLIEVQGGLITWAQIYAYETYWLATAAGIIDEGRVIEALDPANYIFEGGWKIKNVSDPPVPLVITGGYARDKDTGRLQDLIDTSGGFIFPVVDHVVAFATSGGLTAQNVADISGAVSTQLQGQIAKVQNLPDDPASQSALVKKIIEAALL